MLFPVITVLTDRQLRVFHNESIYFRIMENKNVAMHDFFSLQEILFHIEKI